MFGRDVTIEKSELAGFSVGGVVSFKIAIDPEVGTPKAVEVEAADANPAPKPAVAQRSRPAAPQHPAAKRPGTPASQCPATQRPAGQRPSAQRMAKLMEKRHTGVIASFSNKMAAGKITCAETCEVLGHDVAVGADEIAGFIVGDTVSFKLFKDGESDTPKAFDLEAEIPAE